MSYTTKHDGLVIEFDYTPEEKATYDDPGCPPEVEILSVTANGRDITEWVEQHFDLFYEKCFEQIEKDSFDNDYDEGERRYLDRIESLEY